MFIIDVIGLTALLPTKVILDLDHFITFGQISFNFVVLLPSNKSLRCERATITAIFIIKKKREQGRRGRETESEQSDDISYVYIEKLEKERLKPAIQSIPRPVSR